MDSSSSSPIKRYHVFPSFHGPDVRRRFLSHLRNQFASKGITTFNDQEIKRGHTIGPELVQAIRESRVSIVLLSKNYASSSWCLDELVEILKCGEDQGPMTIFYDVDPSDVRKQRGDFGSAFEKTCQGKTEEEKQRWREALAYVATIAGEHSLNWTDEARMVEKFATDVSNKLNVTLSRDFDNIVGLQTHLRKLNSLLCLECDEVRMIGIWGPAGIGKSTIARALFNHLSRHFRLRCFMGNLKGSYKSIMGVDNYESKLCLQSQLLSTVLNQSEMRVCHLGAIKEWLQNQRVLIILDDVDDLDQLEVLAKEHSWFGPGSRIIVTTEDKKILKAHRIEDIYHVNFPSKKEALEILCLSAFKKSSVQDGFEEVATRVAALCGNLPLGLCVVGSSLRGESKQEWELQFSRIKSSLDRKIDDVLRVGYDRLSKMDQSLFLHIACFFNYSSVDYVRSMADSNLDVKNGLKTLADKSLVKISNDQVMMHPLLELLGRQVVREQSDEFEKRQFLEDAEEIRDVLTNEKPLANLKKIDLSNSFKLKEIPNLSKATNLQEFVMKLDLHSEKQRNMALKVTVQFSGILSVALNKDNGMITIVTDHTVNDVALLKRLKKHCNAEIVSIQRRKMVKPEKERANEQPAKEDENMVLEMRRSEGEALSGGPGSRTVTTAVNTRTQRDDWYSFCEFLDNRLRPLTLSGCRAKDAIDFLLMGKTSSDPNVLVGRLSAACEAYGIKPKDNPFRSLSVITYLKEAREVTPETECILFVSSNDNLDVEETSFNKAILKELDEQEVTPLTYNLSGRENLDADMLYRSSVVIVVLSNSRSAPCSQSLDQLVAIMEHWKAKDLVIIPVYFKVTLPDICELEGRFEADRVKKWKVAMTEMASIDGYQWSKGTQFMLAKKIVRNTCLRLYQKSSKNLVRILALLNHPQPSDAEFEGIWGMAGIGKTSIAKEIFEILAPQYDFCYFVQDFHLMCQNKGLRQLRDDFFSKVFREEKLSIGACDTKPSFMRDWFHNKAILVVLDDVSNARDAEYVVGGFGWFSSGHRIILTSRRKQVLLQCKVKEPYEIQNLWAFESFRLCKQYIKEESEVISELMSCSSGIPLALKVLVSSVSKQHRNNMKEHLQSLRKNPPTKIQKAFQRSFDGLDENEKNIFLDLACFFGGENKDDVVQLLDACGFLTYLGICGLIDESLISLLDNRIEIPIPFQDMGRFIVHEEDEDPCERSRLWDSVDIVDVLTNDSGTEAIEGIFLDASDLTCELSPTVFGNMYRLRLLKFYCFTSENESKLNLPQGLDSLPDELRLLHWENYPLECLPWKFNPENLVELNMPYSSMKKLWEGKKNLDKLKKINLSHSRNLTDILMLSEALNLEHIDLEGCMSLVDISTSIPRCGKLVSLIMKDCSRLGTLPSIVQLTSLKILNLSGCFQLEEIQDFAPNLKELYLAGTPIRELPLSMENITELVTLDLQNCRRLQQLPFGIRNSRSNVVLKLSGCTSLESLPNLEALDCGPS